MFCPNCGEENIDEANFCSSCGNELDVSSNQSEDVKVKMAQKEGWDVEALNTLFSFEITTESTGFIGKEYKISRQEKIPEYGALPKGQFKKSEYKVCPNCGNYDNTLHQINHGLTVRFPQSLSKKYTNYTPPEANNIIGGKKDYNKTVLVLFQILKCKNCDGKIAQLETTSGKERNGANCISEIDKTSYKWESHCGADHLSAGREDLTTGFKSIVKMLSSNTRHYLLLLRESDIAKIKEIDEWGKSFTIENI